MSSYFKGVKCTLGTHLFVALQQGMEGKAIFPRINVKDPYQRLGISREASEEEIRAARNFLINKYAGHKPSVNAIESAHDRIIMQSLFDRKKPKVNLKKKFRELSQSRPVKAIQGRFQTPSSKVIWQTAITYVLLGVLTLVFPTEDGPTLQVAISCAANIYFIYQRLKSGWQTFFYGFGSFFASWFLGTFLMVSVIPPILPGPRNLEVSTACVTYALLFVASTFLKTSEEIVCTLILYNYAETAIAFTYSSAHVALPPRNVTTSRLKRAVPPFDAAVHHGRDAQCLLSAP
ncbi:hypothetical protein ABZP36_019555 [Zizania latifolia]